MSDRHSFELRVAAAWPASRWRREGVVVAVSGGADSMALLHALAAIAKADPAGPPPAAAHFNHRLRGAESDADAEFVGLQADALGIPVAIGAGDVAALAARQGDGLEAAARAARYDFLADTAARLGYRYVATAHTLDDQAETVLHRLLRGTGLAGLAGIHRARGMAEGTIGLVRPMLGIRRDDARAYLRDLAIPYRHDSSNDDLHHTRNRLRHELLPALARDYNPQIAEVLARLAVQADDYRELVDKLVEPLMAETVVAPGDAAWSIRCPRLAEAPLAIVRELLVRIWTEAGLPLGAMGYEEWSALAAMTRDTGASARDFPGNVAVRRQGDLLIAARRRPTPG